MERFGLVGLPNAGKSSLYNALTGGGALAAPYPFATKDPNIGVAKVPDERVDRLASMSKSKSIVHAAVQVVDIGGISYKLTSFFTPYNWTLTGVPQFNSGGGYVILHQHLLL